MQKKSRGGGKEGGVRSWGSGGLVGGRVGGCETKLMLLWKCKKKKKTKKSWGPVVGVRGW